MASGPESPHRPPRTVKGRARQATRWASERWLPIALVIAGVGIVGDYAFRSQCQADYNRAFVEQIRGRSDASEKAAAAAAQDAEATAALLTGFAGIVIASATSQRSPEQEVADQATSLSLFRSYLEASANAKTARDELSAYREAHPLPEIPSC